MSIYKEMIEAGVEIDHHESDLFVPDCPEAREVLARHKGVAVEHFTSNFDGAPWLDIPFRYDPFWRKKAG